ncbi:MAG: twin-arginine translocase TatA/TatE family subunit [Bacteroidales bacterium]|nr:twin-arginine translocase TatA/TatE family subunit [Bacteroidales bacterium]
MITGFIFLGMIGHWEILLIVLVIVLIFFGGKKIPELMKGLGKGVRSFKEGVSGDEEKNDKTSDASKN